MYVCMNIKTRHVRLTIFATEKLYYIFWVCICSFSYPACNAHVLYLRLWLVWLYRIFPLCLIKGTIFGKKLNIKYVFLSTLQLLSQTFLILRRTECDMIANVHRSSRKVSVILVRFEWTWILSTNFRTILKYQISWKSVQWEPICSMRADGQTEWRTARRRDGRTDMMKLTVAFRNFANAPKNTLFNKTSLYTIKEHCEQLSRQRKWKSAALVQ